MLFYVYVFPKFKTFFQMFICLINAFKLYTINGTSLGFNWTAIVNHIRSFGFNTDNEFIQIECWMLERDEASMLLTARWGDFSFDSYYGNDENEGWRSERSEAPTLITHTILDLQETWALKITMKVRGVRTESQSAAKRKCSWIQWNYGFEKVNGDSKSEGRRSELSEASTSLITRTIIFI